MIGSDYEQDEIDLEVILRKLDERYKDAGDDVYVNKPLGYLRAILTRGEAYRKELCGVRTAGLSLFVSGDTVKDEVTGNSFEVTTAQVEFIDGKYQWMYKKGFYWIPESDLIMQVPGGNNVRPIS